MPSQPPLPPLLTPYLSSHPDSSLTLVTSVLDATSNWLVLRFLHSSLASLWAPSPSFGLDEPHNGSKKKVVLISFLRGWDFWRTEAKRLGLDLARLADKKQFAFIDGLSDLFGASETSSPAVSSATVRGGLPQRTGLPLRSPPGAVPVARDANVLQGATDKGTFQKLKISGHGVTALDTLENDILAVIAQLKIAAEDGEEILLVIDQPDFLLAATGPSMEIGATEMAEWITGLQQNVHATVITLAADSPLIHNASVSNVQGYTPIEGEHAAFAIGLAHRARSVMQLRTLDTGAATDVSGVLRISRGGGWSSGSEDKLDEKELLYYIQRDGGVRLFGRGES